MTESRIKSLSDGRPVHLIRDMKAEHRLSEQELDELGVIYPAMRDRTTLNAFRELRGKLMRMTGQQNFTCTISSVSPTGDTSRLAINLGAVFAFDRSRTAIVVDCDSGYNLFDAIVPTADKGLIDFIENEHDDLSVLIHESGMPRLRIVPSGELSDTRAECFESDRMKEIMTEIKYRYPDRFIIINAPNMNLSSEVQSLANISDMVIFEVPYASVIEQDVKDAIQFIGQEKVAGVVFSR